MIFDKEKFQEQYSDYLKNSDNFLGLLKQRKDSSTLSTKYVKRTTQWSIYTCASLALSLVLHNAGQDVGTFFSAIAATLGAVSIGYNAHRGYKFEKLKSKLDGEIKDFESRAKHAAMEQALFPETPEEEEMIYNEEYIEKSIKEYENKENKK